MVVSMSTNLKKLPLVSMLAAVVGVIPTLVMADAAADKGLEISQEVERRDQGFVDSESDMTMIIERSGKVSSTREMKIKTLEGVDGEGDKTVMVFLTPADQRGTALLTHKNPGQQDDQWLYLPALKRVKKIASDKKSGPFVGSEFSFEDIAGQSIDEYDYRYLRDAEVNGQAVFIVESYPKDKDSGYSRIVNYIGKAHYRVLKSEFYDRKETLLKTLTPENFKLYNDKFWRPMKLSMVNHQNDRATVLEQTNIEFGTGLDSRDFNQNSLRRIR